VACTSRADKLGGATRPVSALQGDRHTRRRVAGRHHPGPGRRAAQRARQGRGEARLFGRLRPGRAVAQVHGELGQQGHAEARQRLVGGAPRAGVLRHESAASRRPRAGAERLEARGRVHVAHVGKRAHHVLGKGAPLLALQGGAQQLDQPRHRAGTAGRSRESTGAPQRLGAASKYGAGCGGTIGGG
jgi:hypothetical protein